jgi:hypothetical protein
MTGNAYVCPGFSYLRVKEYPIEGPREGRTAVYTQMQRIHYYVPPPFSEHPSQSDDVEDLARAGHEKDDPLLSRTREHRKILR